MEISKKTIKKLIEALEELKKSLKSEDLIDNTDIKPDTDEKEIYNLTIKSPIVGTAYLAPEPKAKPFVAVGKKIKKGETVMIVEAMKTMNHVPSSKDGTVKKIFVEDGQPVEFGQILIALD
tara:strand:+ start:405 stop:767 length:363 start_codon:yes stop_codon:yes gene_type:complete